MADEKNGRGRPRADAGGEKAISVSLSFSVRQYATLCRHARRRHVSPSLLLRKMLARFPGFS